MNETIQAQLNLTFNQPAWFLSLAVVANAYALVALYQLVKFGYQGEFAVTSAAFIEFIHTATLLHDDVVDEST